MLPLVFQPITTRGVGVVGFCTAFMIVFTGCTKHGSGELALFVWDLVSNTNTEVTSPNITDITFDGSFERNHSLHSGAEQAGPAGAAGVPVALL